MRIVLAAVFLLAACARDITAPARALIVTASVSPSTFRAGDSVTVLVTVVNRSDQPQSIETNQCGRAFVVTPPSGAEVGPDPLPCLAYSAPRSLAPGEQYTWSDSWYGRGSVPESTPHLQPGAYIAAGASSIPLHGTSETITLVPSNIQVTP